MSYDLALNRLDHDMVFHQANIIPPEHVINPLTGTNKAIKYSIWPINNADKVAQQIKITLLAFLGEWFLDVTFGVPYLEEILIKNPRMSSIESILRAHITDVPDVTRINYLALSWDRKSRVLAVEFACETNLGPIKESVKLELMRNV